MSHTFTDIDDYEVEDGEVYSASANVSFEVYINGAGGQTFSTIVDIDDIEEADGDWDYDYPDEDYRGKPIPTFTPTSITGSIAEIDTDFIKDVVEYARSRELVIASEDQDAEASEESDFYYEFAGKELTDKLLSDFLDIAYFEDGFILYMDYKPNRKSVESFKDTEYGDLTGQDYKGDIDVTGYDLKSLKGSPKTVSGHFNISSNKNLDTLEFAPEKVGSIDIRNTNIESLEFMPIVSRVSKSYIVSIYKLSDKLKIEFEYIQKNPTLSIAEIYLMIFEETGDERFLAKEAQDIFLF